MNNLRTELDHLEDARLEYVMARSKVNSDAQAIRQSRVPKATFYSWSKEERDNLNELAQKIKRNITLRMIAKLEEAGEDAVDALLTTLKSRNENVKQRAAVEVIDRILGKPTQSVKNDITSGGDVIKITIKDDDNDKN
jgi:glutamyl-tRNA reductase